MEALQLIWMYAVSHLYIIGYSKLFNTARILESYLEIRKRLGKLLWLTGSFLCFFLYSSSDANNYILTTGHLT